MNNLGKGAQAARPNSLHLYLDQFCRKVSLIQLIQPKRETTGSNPLQPTNNSCYKIR